ncbi:SIS domain-containing protein [Paractinoplanes atraurantiacus]|uniref:Fructoselysine-6-P-deglycase FrlB with duplicated sugar isomerase (SIS) domain n=1 Tax=Paractinoplanes atraurantiacus TaxID=1036182 RepID=A0A285F1Z1_9ACTN|nr:sugar isomerase [Actinoplanes atraurantiacus]SNY04704.1 Fructoselysine-6-P-deglycase FrlB with duplicated sugar isomerase (SIS) domain [Actinoplanes atraurantiacus]
MSYVKVEIASQPECWRKAAELADSPGLPAKGERVAVVGCGTSWFMAKAYASLRERAGHGETDAFQASEFPRGRQYDRIVAITRSGTTTEVLDLIKRESNVTVITADGTQPAAQENTAIVLDFADEQSVVQTRFATSALALLRSHLGEDMDPVAADAEVAIRLPLPVHPALAEQITFLGRGWTVGLAEEAALKCREAAGYWAEAYPAMDYRHGPIAIAAPRRVVWAFGEIPAGLADDVEATGASFVHSRHHGGYAALGSWCGGRAPLDPMADLIVAQRVAVLLATSQGLDPDRPRNLTRSVILG